jgi:hypothetical protein
MREMVWKRGQENYMHMPRGTGCKFDPMSAFSIFVYKLYICTMDAIWGFTSDS